MKSNTEATDWDGNFFSWGWAEAIRRSHWMTPPLSNTATTTTTSDLTLAACSTSLSRSSSMLACPARCIVVYGGARACLRRRNGSGQNGRERLEVPRRRQQEPGGLTRTGD